MPDTPTTRLGLYKSASDGSEDVNYTTDIGQNLDRLDAAAGFQPVTSTTRPSSPYSGKPIMETDTSFRTYFSNGTAPASASWVQIPNSSSTFNADLDLTGGRQLNIGGSGSAASIAVLASAAGDDILSTRVSGDTQNRHLIEADGTTLWGPGGSIAPDVNLFRSAANTLKTDDSFVIGGDLRLVGGATVYRNKPASVTTVANTTAETVVASLTIPANDAVVGAIYRIRVVTGISFLASATMTWRLRLGGLAGTLLAQMGATTLSGTAQTDKESCVEADVICVSTGASGTWFAAFQERRNSTQTGSVADIQMNYSDGTVVRDTTASADLVVTADWGAASASNTLTAYAIMERVA
ncbi:hypothetical protein ABZX40_13630 [Streptomyces sp. NPDC004610]|uniref:hypothetical protein n=1 Tax=unclassified Streptomyces TaxID=2593676 RepID=UPI0033BC32B2